MLGTRGVDPLAVVLEAVNPLGTLLGALHEGRPLVHTVGLVFLYALSITVLCGWDVWLWF